MTLRTFSAVSSTSILAFSLTACGDLADVQATLARVNEIGDDMKAQTTKLQELCG